MNSRSMFLAVGLIIGLGICNARAMAQKQSTGPGLPVVAPQLGTAFLYHDRVGINVSPLTLYYDLQFTLWDAAAGGNPIGPMVTVNYAIVINGEYTVQLDFGAGAFDGNPRWLEIAARTPPGSGSYYLLSPPRRPLLPVPYAMYSAAAGSLLLPFDGSAEVPGGAVFSVTNTAATGIGLRAAGAEYGGYFLGHGYFSGNLLVDGWIGTDAPHAVDIHANNQRALRLESPFPPFVNVIGGQSANSVSPGVLAATIAGGGGVTGGPNIVTDHNGAVGGGSSNQAGNGPASVGDAANATVAGGAGNKAMALYSTIAGGLGNTASGSSDFIGGGNSNVTDGGASVIVGGGSNTATGFASTVAGGVLNTASGNYSFAAGHRARAIHDGAFVWADDSMFVDLNSTAANQFTARAAGGVRFFSNPAATVGVQLPPGGGAWAAISDRHAKEHFSAVDARDLLKRLAAIPIGTWNYKSQDPSIRHIGPTAQDFHQAFGVGEDERHITTIDADGVALAAIQALNDIVNEKNAQLESQQVQINRLQVELDSLRSLVRDVIDREGQKPR